MQKAMGLWATCTGHVDKVNVALNNNDKQPASQLSVI